MVATYQHDISSDAISLSYQSSLEELEARLGRGLNLIEERRAAGQSVERLEDHWIALLREYEARYDNLH